MFSIFFSSLPMNSPMVGSCCQLSKAISFIITGGVIQVIVLGCNVEDGPGVLWGERKEWGKQSHKLNVSVIVPWCYWAKQPRVDVSQEALFASNVLYWLQNEFVIWGPGEDFMPILSVLWSFDLPIQLMLSCHWIMQCACLRGLWTHTLHDQCGDEEACHFKVWYTNTAYTIVGWHQGNCNINGSFPSEDCCKACLYFSKNNSCKTQPRCFRENNEGGIPWNQFQNSWWVFLANLSNKGPYCNEDKP